MSTLLDSTRMSVDIDRVLVTLGCVVCTALYLAAISSDKWVERSLNENEDINISVSDNITALTTKNINIIQCYGIWRFCLKDDECHRIGDTDNNNTVWRVTPTWLQAVRILACLATLLVGFGAANGIAGLLRSSYSSKESKICLFIGPLLMLLALTIYTGYSGPTTADNVTWGWCYTVCWFGTCFTPVYGIFAVS